MVKQQKIHTSAPLPFVGQKRNFIKHFRQVINDNIPACGHGWTIIDVFGGSGLLAHNAKRLKPKARVIYNDYDGYSERLAHINDTNRLLHILQSVLVDSPRQKALTPAVTQQVISAIHHFNGYIDVNALATWLLFSGKQVKTLEELLKQKMYNTIRRSDYKPAGDYLDGLETVKMSYRDLMPMYQDKEKVLFLLDPPYLYTGQGAYKQDKYFSMVDFLHLMALTKPPYIFFSSTKSELLEYMDYIRGWAGSDWNRVGGYERINIASHVNYHAKYQDNMIFKF